MHKTAKTISRAGIIAALYAALSLVTFSFSSGVIQFRLSEGLTLLPLIFPEATIALFIGCLVVNVLTGCALYDVIFGSLITLVAATCTFFIGKLFKSDVPKIAIGGAFPVLLNAFLLPAIWFFCYGKSEYAYILQCVFLIISQSASVYVCGSVFYFSSKKISHI